MTVSNAMINFFRKSPTKTFVKHSNQVVVIGFANDPKVASSLSPTHQFMRFDEIARRNGVSAFVNESFWDRCAKVGGYGDFCEVSQIYLRKALDARKIFLLNIPLEYIVCPVFRSKYAYADIRGIEFYGGNCGYSWEKYKGYDVFVPVEKWSDWNTILNENLQSLPCAG
jgi:hypothetical protein